MRIFLILAALTFSKVGAAQVYFNTQIDWEQYFEYLTFIALVNSDGDLFVTGGAVNLSSTDGVTILASLNAEGDVKWQKKFLPAPNLFGQTYHMAKLPGPYGILLGNYEKPIGNGNYDDQIFLTKINLETSDTLWTKEFGYSNYYEQGWTIKPTTNGGLALCGTTFLGNNTAHSKMLFLKTDSVGTLIFRKEYSTNLDNNHYALSFLKTDDGGYLLYGYRGYWGHYLGAILETYMYDMVLVKTDAEGNQEWVKTYPPWEWKHIGFFGFDIQPLGNGDFLIAGLKAYRIGLPGISTESKYFFARINSDGEFVDSATINKGHQGTRVNRLKPSSDGNFWAIGAEKDSQYLGQTGVILKITPGLEVLWKREYRVSPPESVIHEMFYEGVEMPDHGFALCGTAFGPLEDSTYQNGWVIRVDSLGCLEPGCQLSSAIEDLPAAEQDIGITLSPNPTSGQARLALTHEGAVLLGVRVLDMQGRVVSDMQFLRSAGWRECMVDLGGEPAGAYVVQVRSSEGWGVKKIVKQ
ncbi:MAG: T9SS type A sorting domain-containing protein [Saprospiraceae bacterium]|nr:T9SS type A sorting domain-containing protein [Saprospiraceae bacterium]